MGIVRGILLVYVRAEIGLGAGVFGYLFGMVATKAALSIVGQVVPFGAMAMRLPDVAIRSK